MESNILDLLDNIFTCQTKCKYCFNACLEEENISILANCIRQTVACAEICELAISSLTYMGEFSQEILDICIKACEECAKECRKQQYFHCIECAKACQICADTCRDYLKEYRHTA